MVNDQIMAIVKYKIILLIVKISLIQFNNSVLLGFGCTNVVNLDDEVMF